MAVVFLNALSIFMWRDIKDDFGVRKELISVCVLDGACLVASNP